MRISCRFARPLAGSGARAAFQRSRHVRDGATALQKRQLLTLAIESSCDDSCVAILEKTGSRARLLHHNKVTCDNREFRGVHPALAVVSHTRSLAGLVQESLKFLPEQTEDKKQETGSKTIHVKNEAGEVKAKCKPDFVTVTRGPGMTANLSVGLNTAKGLALAWQVPLLGVNHMQAHALTPRMVTALSRSEAATDTSAQDSDPEPSFPFLSLLVSGGHSLLLFSRSLCDHTILAEADNIAIGDLVDKCGRALLPESILAAESGSSVVYGRLLEAFTFPSGEADYHYSPPLRRADEIAPFDYPIGGWQLQAPLANSRSMDRFNFSGLNGIAQRIVTDRGAAMDDAERRVLARETMRMAFEHLGSRVVNALQNLRQKQDAGDSVSAVKTLVVSGGVASNRFLRHVLRSLLDVRGFRDVEIVAPPIKYCTDNAAMIAWTGMEMYEAGWRTDLSVLARKKWPLDPEQEGGILGADGWLNTNVT
ncbi:putative glycoprotease family protein [Phaeoacremonium minimum UCRPA7]|uniref:Putative glycoprotease family protein n=1 Tax=Phaeoacremonium minimum (strain UCR-PA7) TaxID=1286976 RepID=R8BRR9_PHAM7|nr:putative glycoprotease family protein [Phaeoacremonium minimum UCRPA7]EOO02036.1 putative glycoprotease family protein [Phaeoacremonium minimum UCRPA7]